MGTIQLVQQPAQLNVAEKIILPPSYTAELKGDETVPDHQLNFLSAALQQERESIHQNLDDLGLGLKEKVRGEGFEWNGIGTIRSSGGAITVPVAGLEPVPAERVLRQDAEHTVLVGDQEMTSTQIAGMREGEVAGKRKRSIWMIIGWILLILSILAIVFVLYQGKFRIGATGSKQAPTGYLQVDQLHTAADVSKCILWRS